MEIPLSLQSLIAGYAWHEVTEGESDAQVFRLQLADAVCYLKVSTNDAQFSVARDKERLLWLSGRVPVPAVLHYAENDSHQFLLMSAIMGSHPLDEALDWSPRERILFLAESARRFHALPVAECPFTARIDEQIAAARRNVELGRVRTNLFSPHWQRHTPEELFAHLLSLRPDAEDLVVAHGDLYPLNVRVHPSDGTLSGYIDVGATALSDRYTDLAVIANSIAGHLGADWVPLFFLDYGIEKADARKLEFYEVLNEFF